MSTVTTRNRGGPQSRMRWTPIDGPELRCAHCGEWWAITPEFWIPNRWYTCRVCERERSRLYLSLRQRDPAFRAVGAERSRRYRAFVKRTAPEYLPAYDRERKALNRERLRAYRAGKSA